MRRSSAVRTESSAPSLVGLGDDIAAQRAYRGLGITSLRVELLRFVLSRPRVCTADAMQEFGITRNCAHHHLHALNSQGLLSALHTTHPRGSGPITYWSADEAEVEELFTTLLDHVLNRESRVLDG